MKKHFALNNFIAFKSAREYPLIDCCDSSHETKRTLRRSLSAILTGLFTMMVVAGCAKTTITDRHKLVTEQLPRPKQIWVYNFAATIDEMPADSAIPSHYSVDAQTQTEEHLAMGRELGEEIATELVNQIRSMGMPANLANKITTPHINDIVFHGYLISFDEGSAGKRVLIGFGYGASDVKVAVEGFQMTAQGLRKLGYGSADATGGKSPGGDLGTAALIITHNPAGLIVGGAANIYGEMSGKSKVEGRAKQFADDIAKVIKKRFQEQGWID